MYPDEGEFAEVYSGDARSNLVADDEISAEEEAFMNGYDDVSTETKTNGDADKAYEDAFGRRSRRSKRQQVSFDEEEMDSDVLIQ